MKKSLLSLFAGFATASLLAVSSANAQQAFDPPSLTFLQPTGIVSATDTIYINLRFTAGSSGFTFDSSLTNYGLDLGFLYAQTGRQVTSVTDGYLNIGFGCSGTFTNGCSGSGAYNFAWNFTDPTPYNKTTFNVAAGGNYDYLFGTFTPNAGPVAAGTYTFYRSHVIAFLSGTELVEDANNPGQFIEQPFGTTDQGKDWFDIAITCNDWDDSCAFTRTVLPSQPGNVPEPGSLVLIAVALGILGVIGRRRTS
jgi:hypothetical protein